MASTPVLLPGKSHGWRSLVGYCPCGRKKSDTTDQLHLQTGVDNEGGKGYPRKQMEGKKKDSQKIQNLMALFSG